MSLDVRAHVAAIPDSGHRWPGYEQLTGWAILSAPFESGDVLGFRCFPFSDFVPYRSIWHCDPAGDWSVYVDGPALEIGCPRWWGPGLRNASLAQISIEWLGPTRLHIAMPEPELDWTMDFEARASETMMNGMSRAMPAATWRPRPLRAMREVMARGLLRMGRIKLDGLLPTGAAAVLMPDFVYSIEASQAVFASRDLGRPVRAPVEPTVGEFPFPVRGALAIGDFRASIRDMREHDALAARYRAYR